MIIDAARIFSFAFWISCLILFIPGRTVNARSYLYTLCSGRGNYTADSKFQSNLKILLDMPKNRQYVQYTPCHSFNPYSSTSCAGIEPFRNFLNETEGDDQDRVYGLFLCRWDVSTDLCQSCINSATSDILKRCPGEKEAIIWYEECLVRYSNRSFFSIMESTPQLLVYNTRNVSDPNKFLQIVRKTFWEVKYWVNYSENSYADTTVNVSSSVTLYELAQCTPDLSMSDCMSCLDSAIGNLPASLDGKQFATVLQPSCKVQYDLRPIYGEPGGQAPAPSPTNKTSSESGFKGSKRRKAPWVAIVSSVVGSFLFMVIVGLCVLLKKTKRLKKEKENSQEVQLLHLRQEIGEEFSKENSQGEKPVNSRELSLIRLDVIRTATGNFSSKCKLGEGGFGPVYKGVFADGKEIAVKRLSRTSGQGLIELKNEVIVIARLQHRNLVRLLGCCLEEEEKLLIYEYMPNKSLDVFLFDSKMGQSLDWKMRMNITIGIARGLLYLHEDSRLRVIHRDLKASNILLDGEMNPKISDFGLARMFGVNQEEANTKRVVGTYGYMAPEYAMEGLFSIKSDVFSFGVLLLEIISGRKNNGFHLQEHGESLLTFTWKLWSESRGLELIDPSIRESCDEVQVLKCVHIGLLCVQEDPADRPTMSLVVYMLVGDTIPLSRPSQPAFSVGRYVKTLDPIRPTQEACTVNEVTLSDISPR